MPQKTKYKNFTNHGMKIHFLKGVYFEKGCYFDATRRRENKKRWHVNLVPAK